MEGGLIIPPALIGTGPLMGVTSGVTDPVPALNAPAVWHQLQQGL